MSCPATRTVPASAFINVVSTFTVVVLPAPFGPSREKTVPAGTSRSMPSSTVLSPNAFRSPETAIAEVVMQLRSAPGLTSTCHAPDTATDAAFYLVAPGQGSAQPADDDEAELEALKTDRHGTAASPRYPPDDAISQLGDRGLSRFRRGAPS